MEAGDPSTVVPSLSDRMREWEQESVDAPITSSRSLLSRLGLLLRGSSDSPDTRSLLRNHAGLRKNRALMLDLAYEEYCVRRDRGELLDRSEFCRGYPSISRSLYRQIEVEEYVRDHPELIGSSGTVNWPQRGQEVLGFVVVDEIGRGTFARVYLCAQPGMGNRQVVVKVSQGGALEANTMGGLDHPNIMSVYSVGEDPRTGLTGICMPFVGRSTLFDVIDVAFSQATRPARAGVILEASRGLARRGDRYHYPPSSVGIRPNAPYLSGALQVGLQIASGLAHAHERGVIHADLKPSNIVMSVTGRPLIVDFNLAHHRGAENLITGGTLPYMAPEQIRSMLLGADVDDCIDQRSDVFSWGVILYELLTGELPFGTPDPEDGPEGMAGRILDRQHRGASLRHGGGRIDHGVVELVDRCVQFDAAERPESMHAVVESLQRHLAVLPRLRRAVTLDRRLLLGVTGGSLMAAAASGVWLAKRPPLRDRYFAAGVAAYQAGDFPDASEAFRQAIGLDPKFASAYLARACAAMRQFQIDQYQGWLESAFTDVTLAVRHANGHPDAIAARAYCFLLKSQYDLAANEYEVLVELGVDLAKSHNNLGYCLVRLRQAPSDEYGPRFFVTSFDRARHCFETAIELSPDLWQAQFNLATLELKQIHMAGKKGYIPRIGLAAIREAIRFNPNDPATFFVAARIAALVAAADNDDRIWTECLDYCDRANSLGYSFRPEFIGQGHPLYPLMTNERFRAILSREPNGSHTDSADAMVFPSVFGSLFDLDSRSVISSLSR
jgi:tetratricopeptide (TPR) repeat protein